MIPDEHHKSTKDARAGERIQTWYCSDCRCEHEASVIGGVVVPVMEQQPLITLREVESAREEREDYERG